MHATKAGVTAAVLCLCAWSATPADAGTVINTPVVAGRWTMVGSPYYIDCDISVNVQLPLIIDPGVSVIFRGPFGLSVKDGYLLANGTALNPISFSAQDRLIPWCGIRFESCINPRPSSLRYCIISGTDKRSRVVWLPGEQPDPGADSDMCGGAVYIESHPRVSITWCSIMNNSAARSGGGIYVSNASPTITHNRIMFNTAGAGGGGICCYRSSRAHISMNEVSFNRASEGGGIYCRGPLPGDMMEPSITANVIEGNCAAYGGGCFFQDINDEEDQQDPEWAGIVVSENTVIHNSADYMGGGINFTDMCYMTLKGNVISGNEVLEREDEWAGGGGICVYGWSWVFSEGNIIEDNSAAYGGGILLSIDGVLLYSRRDIVRNNVAHFDGGGTHQKGPFDNEQILENDCITGNQAGSNGGGVCSIADRDGLRIFSSTISGNRAPRGGGVSISPHGATEINNSILWGNVDARGDISEVYIAPGDNPVRFRYCDVRGGSQAFAGPGAAAYDAAAWYTPFANIDSDPLFRGGAGVAPPYSLTGGSPCIDKGSNLLRLFPLLDVDLAGNARLRNGTIDIGAYEALVLRPGGIPVGLAN